MAVISFVNFGTTATGTNPTVAVPSGYSAGTLLILFVVTSGTAASFTSDWTQISLGSNYLCAAYKIASASESSASVTSSNSSTKAVMAGYNGANGIDVISSVATGLSTTTVTLNSITPTQYNSIILSFGTIGAATSNSISISSSIFSSNPNSTTAGLAIGQVTANQPTSVAPGSLNAGGTTNLRGVSFSLIPINSNFLSF